MAANPQDPGLGFADTSQADQSETPPPRLVRPRKDRLKIDKEAIASRVVDLFNEDDTARAEDIEARLQRYAKFRMWTEGKDWPWEDASDAAIPDMMTHSLKVQDTLHNAVMSTRPPINSKATQKSNAGKESTIDNLLDYQFFEENKGELIVGEGADAFVNDGVVTAFIPWVKEEREVHEMHTLPAIKQGVTPENYFAKFLQGVYKGKIFRKRDRDGWSWQVLDDMDNMTWFDVEFYTVGDQIEMDAQKRSIVFDGPRPIVKDYEDILAPVRCANLQIPSPSNPGGAAHVIMVDYPTLDEVKRLKKSGFYDLIDDDDLGKLGVIRMDETTGQLEKQQKDIFQGQQPNLSKTDTEGPGKTPDHKSLTRLTCFDIFDIDGDGVNEDVIFWVIKETKTLLRVRELTQVYPADPPRRPFAEASFIPVRGRRIGISLLEMIEGLHDVIKQFADQTIDRGTITNVPFGFYRASGNMRPETIRMWPGELYPLADPKNDVVFPQLAQDGNAFGFNLITMFGQMEEKLTNIGDLQLGRVPQGKSSALRTVRGMQAVLGQGDARPERILRRFMTWLSEVYAQMHELNQVFLPREKQYRVFGVASQNEDPYKAVEDPSAIRGRFQFGFSANAMNTSKEAMQGALDELGYKLLMNPLAIQMGIVKPDGLYRWARDMSKAHGQDPDKYISQPSPEANLTPLFAEEVINLIMQGNIPSGVRPAEANAMEQMQKLMEFSGSDNFGFLSPPQVEAFKGYLVQLRQRLAQEAQQQAQMAAAAQAQSGGAAQAVPGPQGTAPINAGNPQLQKNELLDESLPSAGGGGNPATLQ